MSPSALLLAAALAAGPELLRVEVPPALAEETGFPELSGLVWSAALDRYLAVSDDTGREAHGKGHPPLVLGLDARGRLDASPIPITGIASLKDAEAICAGPEGTFFLATSHSPDRAGRTSRARRQLLHLALRGRSLAVLGRLDLTAIEGGRSLLDVAGLDRDGRLDVEAIAYRDGALFVGLKAPLTASGAAVVLRLADPLRALREGSVRDGALSRWREFRLCVEAAQGPVCQGLSDMLFLDGGALVAAANAPKGGPPDGGGAVWWIGAADEGPAAPRILQRFPGLKPEGLAFSPQRRSLVVVFDRDGEPPLWTELAVPGGPAGGAPAPR